MAACVRCKMIWPLARLDLAEWMGRVGNLQSPPAGPPFTRLRLFMTFKAGFIFFIATKENALLLKCAGTWHPTANCRGGVGRRAIKDCSCRPMARGTSDLPCVIDVFGLNQIRCNKGSGDTASHHPQPSLQRALQEASRLPPEPIKIQLSCATSP